MDEVRMREAVRRLARPPGEAGPERAGQRLALVAGINDYGGQHPALENAVNDALAVTRRLVDDFGFAVTLLLDDEATAGAIQGTLALWAETALPEDELLVFFAGHGTSWPEAGGQTEGYLLPAGAGHDPGSWLSEAGLVEAARTLPAQRVLLIFDACYAGMALRERASILPGARDDQVIKILVAGTEEQPVLDGGAGQHSVFTRALLDGLDGLADIGQQPDGIVAAGELIPYVCSEVPWRSRLRLRPGQREQTPVGGTLQARADGVDFAFFPRRPRLPASLLRNLYSQQAEDRRAAAEQLQARRGTETAGLAAVELIRLLEGRAAAREDGQPGPGEVLEVRQAAAGALGALGEPQGFAPLAGLLAGDGDPALRATAATALGRLVATSAGSHPEATGERSAALETLIGLLDAGEAGLREAAKAGLCHVPAAAGDLAARLKGAPRSERWQMADALACIAMHHPGDDGAWPRLPSRQAQLGRRYHLARRRLAPAASALLSHAAAVGIAGGLGLGLAYLAVIALAFRAELKLYAPAVVTICALPGALAGMALATLPPATSAASRHQDRRPLAIGGLIAGLVLALAMWVPNWFLAIGCGAEGCPRNAALLWLLPGLLLGPALGVAVVALLPLPGRGGGRARIGPLVVVLVSVLGFALAHVPAALATGRVEPRAAEVIAWGLGGLFFGLALMMSWSLAEAPGAGPADGAPGAGPAAGVGSAGKGGL